jgi:hypothetical protein
MGVLRAKVNGQWVDVVGGSGGVQGPPGPAGATGPTGPAGPTVVSADAGNIARLGTDTFIFVPPGNASYAGTVATVTGGVPVNVVHNLNSDLVAVQVWQGGRLVDTDVSYVDLNTVAIATGAPTTVRVVVKA